MMTKECIIKKTFQKIWYIKKYIINLHPEEPFACFTPHLRLVFIIKDIVDILLVRRDDEPVFLLWHSASHQPISHLPSSIANVTHLSLLAFIIQK